MLERDARSADGEPGFVTAGRSARRRSEPRPGDRRRFRTGRRHVRWPVVVGGIVLLAVLAPILTLNPQILRPLVEWLPLPVFGHHAAPAPRMGVEESLLRRQRQGLGELVDAAEKGAVFPQPLGEHALVAVDQGLVQRLLNSHVPSHQVVAHKYDVLLQRALSRFEDGFAFVRREGRVALTAAPDRVFADLTVLSDLSIPSAQPDAAVLRVQVNVIAVDVKRVEVGMESRRAERLAE